MTNQQNVVVLDVKSHGVRNHHVLLPSSLPAVGKSYSPQDHLKVLLMKRFESTDQKINAWVDSMRASSPTRITASLPETTDHDKTSWIVGSHFSNHQNNILLFITSQKYSYIFFWGLCS